jgi:hypothetical protein
LFTTIKRLWNRRNKTGESVVNNNNLTSDAADGTDRDDRPSGNFNVGFSGFAALDMTDMTGGAPDEEEDFGGLMVR